MQTLGLFSLAPEPPGWPRSQPVPLGLQTSARLTLPKLLEKNRCF